MKLSHFRRQFNGDYLAKLEDGRYARVKTIWRRSTPIGTVMGIYGHGADSEDVDTWDVWEQTASEEAGKRWLRRYVRSI